MIIKVLINTTVKKLNKVYSYLVPQELEKDIEIGKRVLVNFGRGKDNNIDGLIVKIENDLKQEELDYKLKSIISVLDEVSYIDEKKLKLAKYMAYTYFCNVYDVIKLMLPPGTASNNSSKNMKDKFDIKVVLAKNSDDIKKDIENDKIKSPKHIELLRFLQYNENVYIDDIVSGLNISKSIVKTVEKNGYIALLKEKIESKTIDLDLIKRDEKKIPTEEQKNAILQLIEAFNKEKYEKFLLHGVTGSGKTEVYLQVIEEVIKKGKKVIFLVPEISLTHQSVVRLVARFGKKVAILHSKMKVSERKEEYKKIAKGEVDIIIGARSAIFAPVKKLGMVIIDEEHDSSYYSQGNPKYSTKEVAEYICKENNSILLLGSATPEIVTYYNALNGNINLITMKNRPKNAILPEIEIVDLKEEKLLGNKSIISSKLKNELIKNKNEGNQSMIFLNRRGYDSYYKCKDCSYIFKCPACDIALTYHKKNDLLHCHYCSHVEKNLNICPVCSSSNIGVSMIGTEKLEEEIKNISDNIKTSRMDADTTVAREALDDILKDFENKKSDILIGTQMISKGHDFSNVTLVGILGVDNLISRAEYTTSEKAFQNLSQVAGRAGRGDKYGKVILETSDEENFVIKNVKNHDYVSFYNEEINYRKIFEYPPFCDIVLFELTSENMNLLKTEAINFYNMLNNSNNLSYFNLFSPKTPHVQKLNNKYRINIIVKTKLNTDVYKFLYEKLKLFTANLNKNVGISITKNPISI